jgi:thiol-disulfide isomerase/thioredoxin
MRSKFEFTSIFQRIITGSFFLILLVVLCLSCQSRQKETLASENASNSVSGKDRRSISFETLAGDPIVLTPKANKWTVLHFWATWCKPCLSEFPEIKKALPGLQSDQIQFLFISDEELDQIDAFQKKYSTGLELIRMKEGSLADFEIYALPTTIVLDREGNEVFRHAGQLHWAEFDSIEELLDQKL